jgi:transcriptional regulator with GAF, ATPase, and Fis domain
MSDSFLKRFLPGEAFAAVRDAVGTANQPAALALRQPVLFLGEPGVGKTRAAQIAAAHRQWLQQPQMGKDLYLKGRTWQALTMARFREVPLTTIPDNLVESELFGYVKGAFTGAIRDHEGIFGSETIADVLLDEIGDVTLSVQPKLLQIIQSGDFRRVGAKLDERRQTNIRLLLATNQDLPNLVMEGRFREDLYWRVSQIVAWVPPIREHANDIPDLLESLRESVIHQIAENNVHVGKALEKRTLTAADTAWAKSYGWPGNIREVERLIRLWLIAPEHLLLQDVQSRFPIPATAAARSDAEAFIRVGVRRWIEEVKSGRRVSPGTIGQMLSGMRTVIQAACADLNLPADDLRVLFPDQAIQNVRSRLSRYARRRKLQ